MTTTTASTTVVTCQKKKKWTDNFVDMSGIAEYFQALFDDVVDKGGKTTTTGDGDVEGRRDGGDGGELVAEVHQEVAKAAGADVGIRDDDAEEADEGDAMLKDRADAMRDSRSGRPSSGEGPSLLARLLTALFYGAASFLITVVNKRVLTTHHFPSFLVLGLGQMVATILVLFVSKSLGAVSFPNLSTETFWKIWPLPLFFLGNMMTGLGGTQALSLPMLTVLRRFSILMTMMGEYYYLDYRFPISVQASVYAMIIGALIAASGDLAFNLTGYVLVLINDFCTAAQAVNMKKKLDSKDLGRNGLLFYNSLFMFVPAFAFVQWTGEVDKAILFDGWADPWFLGQFLLSCVFGFLLNFSMMLCTQYNSPLATTMIGCLKNLLITYLGMIIGGDYIFSWVNFIGINISASASLAYTYVTFTSKGNTSSAKPAASDKVPTSPNKAPLLPTAGSA